MRPYPGKFFGLNQWQVHWPSLPEVNRAAFESIEHLLQQPMLQITLDRRSGVSLLQLNCNYYVKAYTGKGSRIKFWLRRSRYQRELRNLLYFQSLGLQTPSLLAYGHETHWYRLQRAVLVTEEVADAVDLEKVLKSGDLYRNGVSTARITLSLVAEAARKMHAAGFYHMDLKPRNILVQHAGSEPGIFFFDCPSGHHPPSWRLRRGKVRDLAHLQEGLQGHVRRVDLLYMYKIYRGSCRLNDEDKALARDALSYYSNRRMTRKRRAREASKHANAR